MPIFCFIYHSFDKTSFKFIFAIMCILWSYLILLADKIRKLHIWFKDSYSCAIIIHVSLPNKITFPPLHVCCK